MKLKIALTIIVLFTFFNGFAQKKNVTNASYKNWKHLAGYQININGNLVYYDISYNSPHVAEFYLFDSRKQISHSYIGIFVAFSSDGNKFIYRKHDSLAICNTINYKTSWIGGVTGTVKIIGSGNSENLLMITKEGLDILNLNSGKRSHFEGITEIITNIQSTAALLRSSTSLSIITIDDLKIKELVKGNTFGNYLFDSMGNRVAFSDYDSNKVSIYQYKIGSDRPIVVASSDKNSAKDLQITGDLDSFSPDGMKLYFQVKNRNSHANELFADSTKKPRIWSYNDLFTKSNINNYGNSNDVLLAVSGLEKDSKMIQLENDSLQKARYSSVRGNKFVMLRNTRSNEFESYYRPEWTQYTQLLNVTTGALTSKKFPETAILSPSEKFVYWNKDRRLFIYNILSKKTIDFPEAYVYTWGKGDKRALLTVPSGPKENRSGNDLLIIDPVSWKVVVNVTNGFGAKNHVLFSGVNQDFFESNLTQEKLILKGLNTQTKADGFYRANFGHSVEVQTLISEPMLISSNANFTDVFPTKSATNGSAYIFACQSASSSPNLYFTRDFKTITKVSNINPEKDFNWMTSELIKYPKKDGSEGTAILYKPENFDANIKYPVLFHYYQEYTSALNAYRQPDLSIGQLSIPWYVSNGYLVCVPDIINTDGKKIAEITVNSVEGAANYLKQFSWVDAAHMGLQGHSFGGYETGVLITNSHLFAAAQPSAGVFDLVSLRGQLGFGKNELNTFVEHGQFNTGVSLWDNTEVYLKNSPLFKANEVTTPVLIMQGNKDGNVGIAQPVEFFTALRRLKKPSWLLEYNTGHTLREAGEDAELDFTIRQQQFFGHYLKDEPMPEWMK